MNKQEVIYKLKRLLAKPSEIEGSDYDYGHNYGIRRAIIIAEQLDEPEKPVLPQFIADWLEVCKENLGFSLSSAMSHSTSVMKAQPNKVQDWFNLKNNQETFAKAWLYGYEVEHEQQYVVAIPDDERNGFIQLWKNREGKLLFNFQDKIRYGEVHLLTEQEIKQKDERLWQFAEEVE